MKLRFSRARVCEYLAVFSLLILLAWLAHIWVSDRMLALRLSYFIDSLAARSTVQCADTKSSWLRDIIIHSLHSRGSLANQVVYISPSGEVHSCASGAGDSSRHGDLSAENARFRYASATKIVTAQVILDLIREGRLEFDSSLGHLFPEISEYRDERVSTITVGHLLNHSGGFDRLHIGDPMFFSKKKPWCPHALTGLAKVRLQFNPGEKQAYSNVGYCLLGVIAERASGLSFRDLLEQKYKLSSFGIKFIDGPRLLDEAISDYRNEEFFEENYFKDFDFVSNSATAGLSGSALALATFLKQVISAESSLYLTSSAFSKCDISKLRACYGVAFYQYKEKGNELKVGIQEGYLPGTTSVVFIDNHGGVLVLLNAGRPFDITLGNEDTYKTIYEMLSEFYSETSFN